MRCALELLEVVLCVLYVGEVVFCVPLCMMEAVEGALSAGTARSDALCAVCLGGFALYVNTMLTMLSLALSPFQWFFRPDSTSHSQLIRR